MIKHDSGSFIENKLHVFCWKVLCENAGEWKGIIANPITAMLSDLEATWVATPQGWGSSANNQGKAYETLVSLTSHWS